MAEMCLVWMRKMPRVVDFDVLGSPRPASPVETSVANTALVPS